MVKIDYCPSCESKDISKEPGSLTRIMVWRSFGIDPGADIDNEKCVCNNCSLIFSGLRLTEQEEINYYTGYRDETYNKQRDICTPFYKGLKIIFESMLYIKKRQFAIQSLAQKHVSFSKINSVLDFGGDMGDMIPSSLKHADRYVYDIGRPILIDGVKHLDSIDKLFDFIICAHVLEHKSDPSSLIEQLKTHMHSESFLYLEVPYKEEYPLAPNVFDEHLNQWNEKSLKIFLDKHDINIIDMKTYVIHGGSLALKTLLKLNGVS